jgi:ubiquinone/menaquinone biosynthesis C-methylase UbiE
VEARLQNRIQRYGWDRAAADYERCWSRQIEPAQRRLLEMADLQPGERVLDVACGTGLISFPAARAVGPSGWVLGTDISEGMVAQARAEAVRRGAGNVEFQRAGAEDLDLPGDSFDAALCSLGLMYVADPVAALRLLYRFLVPGGRIAAAVWGRREHCGWAGIFPVVDARVKSEVCPLFFQLGTGDAMRDALGIAGFSDIGVERLHAPVEYDSDDEAIGAAFIGGPVAMAYSRFDQRTRAEAHAEYLRGIARYRTGRGYALPGEYVLATGRKPGVWPSAPRSDSALRPR